VGNIPAVCGVTSEFYTALKERRSDGWWERWWWRWWWAGCWCWRVWNEV